MKIKSGDTLSAIAKKNGTTIAKILAANPTIKNANSIKAGQSITMPKKGFLDSAMETVGLKKRENIYKGYKNPLADKLKAKNPSTLKKKKSPVYQDKILRDLKKKKTTNTTADAMTKAGEERTRIVKKYKGKGNSTSSANPTPGRMEGGPPQRKGTKSIGSKVMGFIKGEGKKISSDFDKRVKETKRNVTDKRYFVNGVDSRKKKIKSKSNITNSSSYKGKQNKGNT